MERGWRLTKVAWAHIRRDSAMVSIALMGAGCGLAKAGALLYSSGYFSSPTHSRGNLPLAAIIGLYPMTSRESTTPPRCRRSTTAAAPT